MSKKKRQHFVPVTYLNAWKNEQSKISIYDKKTDQLIDDVNPRSAMFKKNLYTLKAGDLPILDESNLNEVFGLLKNYKVFRNTKKGKVEISELKEMANVYWDFGNWIILDGNNEVIDNEKIQVEIEEKRILEIEDGLSDIEDEWFFIRKSIEDTVLNNTPLSDAEIAKLKEFISVQKWRTEKSNAELTELLRKLTSSVFQGTNAEKEMIFKDLSGMYFKKQIKKYLTNAGEGIISTIEGYLKSGHLTFHTTVEKIITSDNPVIIIHKNSELNNGNLEGLFLPITPTILAHIQPKTSTEKLTVRKMNKDDLNTFNKLMKMNSNKIYVK